MKSPSRSVPILTLTGAFVFLLLFAVVNRRAPLILPVVGPTTVHHAAAYDVSPPLASLRGVDTARASLYCGTNCGTSPGDPDGDDDQPAQGGLSATTPSAPPPPLPAAAVAVEQKSPGTRPPALLIESFDGLGYGFDGPQGASLGSNPSDNSLAAGPDHIVQIVNSHMAIFSKKGAKYGVSGKVLYGAVPTNTIFKGFGGPCEERNNGDAVVRYDQLADRWLFVMPFSTPSSDGPTSLTPCATR